MTEILSKLFETYAPSKIDVYKKSIGENIVDNNKDMFADFKAALNDPKVSDIVVCTNEEPDKVIHCNKAVKITSMYNILIYLDSCKPF